MRRRLRTTLAIALLIGTAAAQGGDDVQRLRADYEKKLAKDFVARVDWVLDYDEARATAKAEGKLIFTYFTRSYAP